VNALVKRAVESIAGVIGWAQISLIRRRTSAGDAIVVLDIDNTIADAWPSFLTPFASHRSRLAGLEMLPNVKEIAHDRARAEGAAVVFLSHRNLWEWDVTYRWLRDHGFAVRADNLVLVPTPAAKLPHLRRLARDRELTVWDDLSRGHETGTVTFYAEVIAALAGVSLTYKGWDDIVTLSGLGLERD